MQLAISFIKMWSSKQKIIGLVLPVHYISKTDSSWYRYQSLK